MSIQRHNLVSHPSVAPDITLNCLLTNNLTLDQFNSHIQGVIVPEITIHNPYYEIYSEKFVAYVLNFVLPSLLSQDKKFLCLLWYMIRPDYQLILDSKEPDPERAVYIREQISTKFEFVIAGLTTQGNKAVLNTNEDSRHKHTLGYTLNSLRLDYINF